MRSLTRFADKMVNRLAPKAAAAASTACYNANCGPQGCFRVCCPGKGCGACMCP